MFHFGLVLRYFLLEWNVMLEVFQKLLEYSLQNIYMKVVVGTAIEVVFYKLK